MRITRVTRVTFRALYIHSQCLISRKYITVIFLSICYYDIVLYNMLLLHHCLYIKAIKHCVCFAEKTHEYINVALSVRRVQ